MFLWLIGEMIIASWLWHLISLMSSLASSPSSNLPFTVFCGNYWRVDASGAILKLAPLFNDCDVEATVDVHLQFATSRHILPFLRCKSHSQVVRSEWSSIISEFLCSYWMQELSSDTKRLILLKMRGVTTAPRAMKWNSPSDIGFHRFTFNSLV